MNDEALPETGLAVERFWDGLGAIIRGFAPVTASCWPSATPCRRGSMTSTARTTSGFNAAAYEQFLREIGYLLPEPPDFAIRTAK